jgi:stage II sporulation protein D
MRSSFKRVLTAALLTCALVSPNLILKAQDAQPATRPRRATEPAWPTTSTSEPLPVPEVEPEVVRLTQEPVIRIGLATGARSVTVSTTGRVLNATDSAAQPLPLDLARVRIEPRTYPTLPTPEEQGGVQTASTSSSKPAPAAASAKTNAQPPVSSAKAERESSSGVRLTSRAAEVLRGEALYAPGSPKPLLDLRAPVVFAPEDPEQHPVRYNEKPYRGRLEVFANTKGTLTVVNVISLEDYVRGVVPNELSPGGWPELEALKAQAVAARTYAVSNRGRYASQGYDLTPDTRSQVYGGLSTEHPLTDRAVAETRGRILTYKGAPVNALYTSTCGGRTEDGENIFGGSAVAYLRGRECALEEGGYYASFGVRTSREPANIKSAEHASSARDAALLAVHGFDVPARLGDEWLASNVTAADVHALLSRVAALARQAAPTVSIDAARPGGFATALAAALDGESRGKALFNSADVEYQLAFRDASQVPAENRSDVAAMLREGHLALLPDGSLQPRQPLTRARLLRAVAHAAEARGLLRLQKAAARLGTKDALTFRPAGGKDLSVTFASDVYLFRAFGETLYAVREVRLIGDEAVVFHTNTRGEVDYLEVRPAASGAASDRASKYSHWSETLTPSGVLSRLSRSIPEVGTLLDLRVRRRGISGRVLDLEVVGTAGTAHVRGGRVRTALGLREQLFVIDRTFDESGRVSRFTFTGRGWGHGVGMCQVGAYGLARAGLSYEKILKHFYTGVGVTKLY